MLTKTELKNLGKLENDSVRFLQLFKAYFRCLMLLIC